MSLMHSISVGGKGGVAAGTGHKAGISLRGVPLIMSHMGETFWVDENANTNVQNGTYANPFPSIQRAVDACLADRGDVIFVKPGHIENIAADDDIDFDCAGVACVGLGTGSKQAKISWDADVSISVSAHNISIVNMWLYANYEMVDNAIDVDAVDFFTVEGCRISDAAAVEFEEFITLASGADDFHFINNIVQLVQAGTTDELVRTTALSERMHVVGNIIVGPFDVAAFCLANTKLKGGALFANNIMVNTDGTGTKTVALSKTSQVVFANECHGCNSNGGVCLTGVSASYLLNVEATDLIAVGSVEQKAVATLS